MDLMKHASSPFFRLYGNFIKAIFLCLLCFNCKPNSEPSPVCAYSQTLDCNKNAQIYTLCSPGANGVCYRYGGLRNDTLVARGPGGINTRYVFKNGRLERIFDSNRTIAIIKAYDPVTHLPSLEFRSDVGSYNYTKMEFMQLKAETFTRIDSIISLDWKNSVPGNLVFNKVFLGSTEVTYDHDNLTKLLVKNSQGKTTNSYVYEYDDKVSPFYMYYMLLEFPYDIPGLLPLPKNNITKIRKYDGNGLLQTEVSYTYAYQCNQIMSRREMVSGGPSVCYEFVYFN